MSSFTKFTVLSIATVSCEANLRGRQLTEDPVCTSWTRVGDANTLSVSGNGVFCQNSDASQGPVGSFKCNDAGAQGISVDNCKPNMVVKDADRKLWWGEQSVEQPVEESFEKEIEEKIQKKMEALRKQAAACTKWTEVSGQSGSTLVVGNGMTGLFCHKNSKIWKCDSIKVDGATFMGSCLDQADRKLWDQAAFEQQMKEMEEKIRKEAEEQRKQAAACTKWTQVPGQSGNNLNLTNGMTGLFCSKNNKIWKCDSVTVDGATFMGACVDPTESANSTHAPTPAPATTQAPTAGNADNNACTKWTKVQGQAFDGMLNVGNGMSGVFCSNAGEILRCDSDSNSDNSITFIGQCPANARTLSEKKDADGEDASLDEAMKELDQQIKDCKKWDVQSSNNVSGGGLFCHSKDNKTYKCSVNPLTGNNVSYGDCPANITHRALSEDDSEFDRAMEELNQQLKNCQKWEEVHSNTFSGGLFCHSNDNKNYKCSVNPLSGGSTSFGDCPANINTHRALSWNDIEDSYYESEDTSFDRAMDELHQQIQNCKKWDVQSSNNVSGGGLFCQSNDNKTYKCSENPLSGGSLGYGECPADITQRSLSETLII
jgi:hypothetical protein